MSIITFIKGLFGKKEIETPKILPVVPTKQEFRAEIKTFVKQEVKEVKTEAKQIVKPEDKPVKTLTAKDIKAKVVSPAKTENLEVVPKKTTKKRYPRKKPIKKD